LTRWTVLDPTRHSRAVFNIPLPPASDARIASSTFGSTRARPLGPFSLALAMPDARVDPLLNDRPFEFGEYPEHLK
jgi:hypothetical protein